MRIVQSILSGLAIALLRSNFSGFFSTGIVGATTAWRQQSGIIDSGQARI